MADESAIIKLQSVIRKHMARREFSYLVRRERLLHVMMAIEDEKATLVQTLCRQRAVRGRDELASVTKLQAAARGKLARRDYLPEHKVPAPKRPTALCIGMANSAPAAPRCTPFAPPPAPAP